MQPIEALDLPVLAQLEGLVFDLDDTFLDHGTLNPDAFQALWQLKNAGFQLLVATGRPAGWGEVLARLWPVHAVVSENGAIAHINTATGVEAIDPKTSEARQRAQSTLGSITTRIEQAFPELRTTSDAHARLSDVTYDIGERRTVAPSSIQAVQELAEELGAHTLVSSVHLHVTLERDDKATGCLRVLRERFGWDTTSARARFAFIGDSGNDAACFAAFHTTIAVANLSGNFTLLPRYITRGERAVGFVEAAGRLLAGRATATRSEQQARHF